jgi:capsular exopolysaccharide synthesis family protein
VKLSDYLQVIWRRKWIIVLTMLITVGIAAAVTASMDPEYTSSTTLRVSTAAIGSFDFLQYDLTYTDRLMNTYARIAASGPVIGELMQRLQLDHTPDITVDTVTGTELMQIQVTDKDPVLARNIADTLGQILIANIEETQSGSAEAATEILREQLNQVETELNTARGDYESLVARFPEDDERVQSAGRSIALKEQVYNTLLDQYETARSSELIRAKQLSIVEPAFVPRTASNPNSLMNLALGMLVGAAAGLSLAFLFENLDTTLHTSEQIETMTGVATLGKIPTVPKQKRIVWSNASSPEAEAYRSLRTNIFMLNHDRPLRTLAVTSAEPNEGKSTTVANLAIAMAQSGRKVVVVDGDLRRPTLHKIFGLTNQVGLSSVLRREVELWEAIQNTDLPGLHVIASGKLPSDPLELLSSDHMSELLDELAGQFDVVLLDVPASRVVSDASVLASMVDGVLLVVGRSQVKQEEVRAAYDQLVNVKARVVGVVINRAEENKAYHDYIPRQSA